VPPGLTALAASSLSRPDAVLAFLGGTLGVPAAGIAAVVAMDPVILCTDVEQTLAPRVSDLSDIGLSRDEIVRLIPLAPTSSRNRFLCSNFDFWLKELGSFDKLLLAVRMNSTLLSIDLDKVAKPNLALLEQCGLNASEMGSINIYATRLLTMNPNLLQRVEGLGFKRGTRMFRRGLVVISLLSKETVDRRIQLLGNLGFSQDDVLGMVRRTPSVLSLSDNKVQANMDFLMKDVGLDLPYIARRPALLMYSIERRLLPRYWLFVVLKEKALLKGEPDYYVVVSLTEKLFVQKFVLPYKDTVPASLMVMPQDVLGRQQLDFLSMKMELICFERH
jgi:mTERF domain-containing protein, mitochondrial